MIEKKSGVQRLLLFGSILAAFLFSGCIGLAGSTIAQPTFDLVYIIYPLLAAFGILALAFMAAKAFNMQHWVPIIGDEVMQLFATGAVALLLVGTQIVIDGYLANSFTATGETLPASCAANKVGCVNDIAYAKLSGINAGGVLSKLTESSQWLGQEASKGIYCSMLGVGFTLSNCGQLNAYRGTLTLASFAATAGLMDIYAQQFLLTLAKNFSFSFLIPLGLFFRCFKISRPAGGALIAIGFGFYTAYPLAIVAMTNLLTGFAPGEAIMAEPPPVAVPTLDGYGKGDCRGNAGCGSHNNDRSDCLAATGCYWLGVCDAYESNSDVSRSQFNDYANKLTDPSVSQGLTYLVLVKAIFLSILNLIITLGFVRVFAHLLGSDIDVSSLARIT